MLQPHAIHMKQLYVFYLVQYMTVLLVDDLLSFQQVTMGDLS
jgi:hypothetical protein